MAEDIEVSASPKAPWGELPSDDGDDFNISTVLLWLPNRILDLIDIFRVDVGVGPAIGAVGRITRHGQFGYREFSPASLRVGNFGRSSPLIIERSSEFGVGPAFVESNDRKVCSGEVGVGADILIVGGYVGICFEELADFLGGLLLFDLMQDDLSND